jgi:hypothetical protein
VFVDSRTKTTIGYALEKLAELVAKPAAEKFLDLNPFSKIILSRFLIF